MKDEMQEFLETNNLLDDSQHGFRKNRSCLTNLLGYLDYVTENLDNVYCLDVVYLDFSKAFDKVPHNRLIYKLQTLGITGLVSEWIKEWLHDRKMRVVLNGETSLWKSIKSSVPQGSVLGPLLFIIFMNDFDTESTTYNPKFADDTKLVQLIRNVGDYLNLQNSIDKAIAWAEKWQMEFNSNT